MNKINLAACAMGLLVFAPVTSFSLELGDAAIRSGLGQSLLVEIPYRLAVNERLTPACVRLVPAPQADGLPTYASAGRVTITPTHIQIFGGSRVLEPLIGLTVDVHCNSTPRFVRSYQLFVDPPGRISSPLSSADRVTAARPEPASSPTNTEATTTPRVSVSARARGQSGGMLAQGQTYLVVRGDTLSGIAARVADRGATIRETAEAIFATNPEAFLRGNPDFIEAGRSITIPVMTPTTAPLPLSAAAATPSATPSVARDSEPITPTAVPSAERPPAPAADITPVSADAGRGAAVPDAEPSAPSATDVQRSAAPVQTPGIVAPESTSTATPQRTSNWLTILLAIGVAVLSTPLLLLRRRKPAATTQGRDDRARRPRLLVDPAAGFDVVEGQLAPATSGAAARVNGSGPLALGVAPTDSVDLDVGAPLTAEERVEWFEDRAAVAASASQPSLENEAEASDPTLDDRQHTLTLFELDMLRQDYEVERTMTQEANTALRDAVADLNATQAALVAGTDTVTLEMPRPETSETQPAPRQRSSSR